MYILTSPFSKTFDTLGLLYFVPDFLVSEIKEGIIVECPMGKTTENAIILEIIENIEDFCSKNNIRISDDKIRSITGIVTTKQFVTKNNILLARFISNYYFTQIHNSINLFFPNIIRKKIFSLDEKFFERIGNSPQPPLEGAKNNPLAPKGGKNCKVPDKGFRVNKFSTAQEKAYLEIKNNFNLSTEGFSPLNLLYGITGSGKTEIYIKLIIDNLSKNKQSLLLIPEIILNNQIGEKLKNVFGEENILIINSSITDGQKVKYFADIYSGKAKIIIGTRSSLFYPYKNLGLIIMDEEHDNSYNSDKSPRYKTKEILQKLQELDSNLNILLASGTPSIDSMYKGVKKQWNLVTLLEKYNQKK